MTTFNRKDEDTLRDCLIYVAYGVPRWFGERYFPDGEFHNMQVLAATIIRAFEEGITTED